jgi:putative acetyltransferase
MPYSRRTEAAVADALRAAGALAVSLVAVADDEVVGHVAFSPVTIDGNDGDGDGWYGVGPVSVRPDRQRQGIGSALVKAGLARIAALGGRGCVLVGDSGYYGRFGFESTSSLVYAEMPSPFFQALALAGTLPSGTVAFHAAFAAQEP